jgi:hypothetical protein
MTKDFNLENVLEGKTGDDYSISGNIVSYKGKPVCRMGSEYSVFSFGSNFENEVFKLNAFAEVLPTQVIAVPEQMFSYPESIYDNAEICGDCWVKAFEKYRAESAAGNKKSFYYLECLLDNYFLFYKAFKIAVPDKARQFIVSNNLQSIKEKCFSVNMAKHQTFIEKSLEDWRVGKGRPVLPNKTGKEYLRFNPSNNTYESLTGVIVDKVIFESLYKRYLDGERKLSVAHTVHANNEAGELKAIESASDVVVSDDGSITINCMVISKEEIINAINNGKNAN